MKILIIGTAYPYRGGLAVYNERLAKAFAEQNYTVEIETFTLQYPNFLFPGKTQYAEWEYSGNIKIRRTINAVNPLNWLLTGRRLIRANYDLIIIKYWLPFMSPCFSTLAKCIHKNSKTVLISILDNVVPHEKRIGDKQLTKIFVNNMDGFIAMSKSVQADLRQFTTIKKCKLSPHPLYDNFGEKLSRETALQKLKLDTEFRYILFFGLIRDYKGLDILLDVMTDKRIIQMPVKLIVAGEFYSGSEKYYTQIKNNNINDRIIIYPQFISDNEVNQYFGAADIVVQPYKHATQSGVTQIAYHFEKPMIVTCVGGLSEIVPHQKAGYVTNVNTEEISDAIVDFFTKKTPDSFKKGIIEEKAKYSWDKLVYNIIELYKSI